MSHPSDAALALLARDQCGTFSYRQAKGFGANRDLLARRTGPNGPYEQFHESAFGFRDWPKSWERMLWLAKHAAHPDALIGGLSAPALYGFKGFPRNRVDLLTPHGTLHVNPFGRVLQTRHMPTRVARVNNLPVPSIERVLCDAARLVGPLRLGVALDDLIVRRRTTLPRVRREFLALATPAWPGLRTMAAMLAARGDEYVPPRSFLDRELRVVVSTIVGATPLFEVQIGDRDEMAQIVDCVFEEPRKLIVEADGRAWHQQVADIARDRQRDRRAGRLGYETYRFVYEEIVRDPESVRAEICEYLGL